MMMRRNGLLGRALPLPRYTLCCCSAFIRRHSKLHTHILSLSHCVSTVLCVKHTHKNSRRLTGQQLCHHPWVLGQDKPLRAGGMVAATHSAGGYTPQHSSVACTQPCTPERAAAAADMYTTAACAEGTDARSNKKKQGSACCRLSLLLHTPCSHPHHITRPVITLSRRHTCLLLVCRTQP